MKTGITVIVPSIGRPSLEHCLKSIAVQLDSDDAVIVIFDGLENSATITVEEVALAAPKSNWTWVVLMKQQGEWGHIAANYALTNLVETSHVWRLDDDDLAAPGALEAMRDHFNDPWTIFRMKFGPGHPANGHTCWMYPRLMYGDIGTPMVFAKYSQAKYGKRYEGDYDYALSLREELGEPVWDERVVALVRP